MTKTYLNTKGLIIRKVNYSDKDLIIELLTEDGVLETFYCRNVKSTKNHLASVLQFGILLQITYRKGRTMNYPQEINIVREYKISSDLKKMILVSDILKIISQICKNYQSEELFNLLLNTLQVVQAQEFSLLILEGFIEEVLELLSLEDQTVKEKQAPYTPENIISKLKYQESILKSEISPKIRLESLKH